MPSGGVWRRASLRRREEVARSRILGALAVGWVFTLLVFAVSIAMLTHASVPLFARAGLRLLALGLVMVGVNELMRRGNQIAIGAWLGLSLLSQLQAWRALHGSMLGWNTIVAAIIILVMANGFWGAVQLQAVRHEMALVE